MASEIAPRNTAIVYCVANRGKRYRVVFHGGDVYTVFSVYRKFGTGSKDIERRIWHRDQKRISLVAYCAIDAARNVRAVIAKANSAPPDRSALPPSQEPV